MSEQLLFDRLFGAGKHQIVSDGLFLHGGAQIDGKQISVIGTRNQAALDVTLALRIADAILQTVHADAGASPRPILFIADTSGQALSRHDELLGLNGYFAHIARCVDLARRNGHKLVTLIHGEAVSGGFLAYGMLADRICALPDAQVRVMDLRAMSRVTKINLERLEALATESPVFAPGAANFWKMGGIHDIWSAEDNWTVRLVTAFDSIPGSDSRAAIGYERGGRQLAAAIARLVTES